MSDNASPAPEAFGTPGPSSKGQGIVTPSRAIAITAASALLVGLIVGPIIANNHAQGADTTGTTPEHTITVSGAGDVSVAPDVADVYLGVSATAPKAVDARASAATQMTAVIAAIRSQGVADKDITTVNVSLNPVYDYSSGSSRLTGYLFSNSVKIVVRDLNKVAAVIDSGVGAGANSVSGVTFRLNDPKTVQSQARSLAMTDAHNKAVALAQAAGVQIKGVASISETSSSTPIYYSAGQAMDAAKASVPTPIQTGTTDVTVQVMVSYLIG